MPYEDRQDFAKRMRADSLADQVAAELRDGNASNLTGTTSSGRRLTENLSIEAVLKEMRQIQERLSGRESPYDRIVMTRATFKKIKELPECSEQCSQRDYSGVGSLFGIPLELWDWESECVERGTRLFMEGVNVLVLVEKTKPTE